MGTTMAFFYILNESANPDALGTKMKEVSNFSNLKTSQFNKMFEQSMTPEMLKQIHEGVAATRLHFDAILGRNTMESRPAVAYSENARWLQLFEEHLCEGTNASNGDLTMLHSVFDAPVLAFSIFDSDVLLISYIDSEKRICSHAKQNIGEFDEAEKEGFSTDFPEFLLAYCDKERHDKLRDIWGSEGYVFADDRMRDICTMLDIAMVYQSNEIPEGYRLIFASSE